MEGGKEGGKEGWPEELTCVDGGRERKKSRA